MGFREPEAARRAREAANQQRDDPENVVSRFISREEDGTYVVSFPKHHSVVSKGPIRLSSLHRYPNIADAIAFGYTMHGLSVTGATRRYYIWQGISSGFLKFVDSFEMLRGGQPLELREIDKDFLRAFKDWLDDPENGSLSRTELTRRIKIQEIQLVLKALMSSKIWAPHLSPKLELLQNLYPGAHRRIKHTDILDDVTLERLYVAAADDCEAIIKQHRSDRRFLAEAIERQVPLEAAGQNPFDCAAFMLRQFGQPLPPYWRLIRKTKYSRSVSADVYAQMQRILYPDLDELLPFMLLLSIMFAFNPGVVLNMTHDDYETETLFGRERIRLKPFKPRSHRNQINTVLATDDLDNPRTIFTHLTRRCERLRELLPPEFQNRVFVRFSPAVNRGVAVEITDDALRDAIARFCERHGEFEPFQLKQIRPTTLDLVHEITGGNLLAMQQVANHSDPNTTQEFYTSAAFQRRNEEMLAAGMQQLERKYRTEGRVDPVERHRLRSDLASATPGFACLDPFNSPQPGQGKGLCQAYGRCPVCELAMIDPTSPHAYAYLFKLRKALDDAAGRLGPAWLYRWAPVKEKVTTFWARLFTDPEVVKRGVQLATFTIPDLPALD